MASSVVKRIPLIRFPSRIRIPTPPAAASAPASAPSALGAESKTPPTTEVDAGSSRPLHSTQKPSARGAS